MCFDRNERVHVGECVADLWCNDEVNVIVEMHVECAEIC